MLRPGCFWPGGRSNGKIFSFTRLQFGPGCGEPSTKRQNDQPTESGFRSSKEREPRDYGSVREARRSDATNPIRNHAAGDPHRHRVGV